MEIIFNLRTRLCRKVQGIIFFGTSEDHSKLISPKKELHTGNYYAQLIKKKNTWVII